MKAEEEKRRWTEGTDLGQTSVESKMPIANAQGYKAENGSISLKHTCEKLVENCMFVGPCLTSSIGNEVKERKY